MELAIGTQYSLPYRYTHDPGATWPNCIDPCVFYDEEGNLLMSYGSFFGGIWLLELDESTGLRDYNVNYGSDFDSRQTAVSLDPYFGRKIAGGCGATGEGSYIEYIGGYYYLFVYGAQNEAYNVERGRNTPKAVYLQRVARVEAVRSAQNEMYKKFT